MFSLVRLEKLWPALIPLGDGDEGWTYAKLQKHQPSPGEESSGRHEHLETEEQSPERRLQHSADRLSPEWEEEQSDAFNPNLVRCQIQTVMGLGWECSVV